MPVNRASDYAYHTSRFTRDSPGLKALSQSVNQKVPVRQSASIALHEYELAVTGLFSELAEEQCAIIILVSFIWIRGHQHGAHGHQVARGLVLTIA